MRDTHLCEEATSLQGFKRRVSKIRLTSNRRISPLLKVLCSRQLPVGHKLICMRGYPSLHQLILLPGSSPSRMVSCLIDPTTSCTGLFCRKQIRKPWSVRNFFVFQKNCLAKLAMANAMTMPSIHCNLSNLASCSISLRSSRSTSARVAKDVSIASERISRCALTNASAWAGGMPDASIKLLDEFQRIKSNCAHSLYRPPTPIRSEA